MKMEFLLLPELGKLLQIMLLLLHSTTPVAFTRSFTSKQHIRGICFFHSKVKLNLLLE